MWPSLRIASKKPIARFALIFVMLATGCSQNYLANFVTTPNDESLLYSARADIRSGSFDSAITDCAGISASALSEERFATVCASAYAGRCGFTMGFITSNISSLGSAPWSAFVVSKIGTTAVSAIADCDTAENILRSLGAPAARSADANFFLVTLALYKMGVIAKALGDPTNTGTVSGAFDACSISSAAPTNYQLMTAVAVWDILKTAATLTSDPLLGTAATLIVNQCTALSTVSEDLCGVADPTTLAAGSAGIKGGLSTLKEGTVFGVNQSGCGGQSVLTASCRCP